METIRILQDTYEKLYVITPLLAELLENEMHKTSTQWKQECDTILGQKCLYKQWSHFNELDSYYLLKLLKFQWNKLKGRQVRPDFFTNENKKLFVSNRDDSILSIRNKIAHPERWNYGLELYNRWNSSLVQAAKELGSDLTELLQQYHEPEKQRIFKIINDTVIAPALRCAELPPKKSDKAWKTRGIDWNCRTPPLESSHSSPMHCILILENPFAKHSMRTNSKRLRILKMMSATHISVNVIKTFGSLF